MNSSLFEALSYITRVAFPRLQPYNLVLIYIGRHFVVTHFYACFRRNLCVIFRRFNGQTCVGVKRSSDSMQSSVRLCTGHVVFEKPFVVPLMRTCTVLCCKKNKVVVFSAKKERTLLFIWYAPVLYSATKKPCALSLHVLQHCHTKITHRKMHTCVSIYAYNVVCRSVHKRT